MPKLNVLVVGASVAGPTAAYWLSRAGARVTVIERFPELRKGGQNVDIRLSGVTIMQRMAGMEEAVRASVTGMKGMACVDPSGRVGKAMKSTGDADAQSLVSEFEIFRGDLSKIIFDLCKDDENIRWVFDEQIKSLVHHQGQDGPVTVEFANGHLPTADYDLVVACDGATSRTRAMAFDCGVRDHINSLNAWVAYFTISRDLLGGGKIGLMQSMPRGRSLILGPDPAGPNRGAAWVNVPPPLKKTSADNRNNNRTLAFQEAQKQGTEATKQLVVRTWADCTNWLTPVIIKEMLASDEFYASEVMQVKMPHYYRGRVVLVGDAGYAPQLGAGTSMALSGAYVLAGEISRFLAGINNTDINSKKSKYEGLAKALQAYEDRMKPIVTECQKVPFIFPAAMAPQTLWGIHIRNTLFGLIASTSWIFAYFGKLFANAFGGDNTGIPEYDFGGGRSRPSNCKEVQR